MAAMLAAVEIYNKPQMTYRDEVVVINVVNAWELALKAALRQNRRSIYYAKKKGERYRTLSLDDCLTRMTNESLWPAGLDGPALTANLKALSEYRNRAIHLYNAEGLGAIIYPFLQQNILNYRDFFLAKFKKDLAEHMTWQLLPLGATIPSESVRFMRGAADTQTIAEVQEFIDDVRTFMDRAEQAGSDMGRVATMYDINLQSVKKMTSADLVVAVSSDAEGQIVMKKTDPNQTHPFTTTELLKKVNERRTGRALNTYDHTAVCWDEDLRDASEHAWKHSNAATHVWSGAAVTYLASKTDDDYDAARTRYREHMKAVKAKKS